MNSHLNTESQIHILAISNASFHSKNTRVNFQNTFSTPLLLPNENYEIGLKTIGFDLKFHKKDISCNLFKFHHDLIQFQLSDNYISKHRNSVREDNFYAIHTSVFDNNKDKHTYLTFIKTLNDTFGDLLGDYFKKKSFFSCVENDDGSVTFSCRLTSDVFKKIVISEALIKLLKLEKIFNDKKWFKIKFGEKLKYWRFNFYKAIPDFLRSTKDKITLTLNSVIKEHFIYTKLPKFIIVKLHELTSTEINFGEHDKIIAMLPIKRSHASSEFASFKYENINNTFHKIKTKNSEIHGFKITLENENHKVLKLQPGQPTVIQLLLKEMGVDHHIIRFSSHPSIHFPKNTSSNFGINLQHLHNVITNYHEYEIGLHSIFLPKLLSLPKTDKEYFYIMLKYMKKSYKIELEPNAYMFELSSLFSQISIQSKKQSPLELTFATYTNVKNILKIKINRYKRENITNTNFQSSMVTIKFSPYLWYVLTNTVSKIDKEIYSESVSSQIEYDVETTVQDFELNFNFKERLTPHFCFLNCDGINPHIVGESYDQVFQCIPIDVELTLPHPDYKNQIEINKKNELIDSYFYYKPEEISYFSICKIHNMHFILKNLDGFELSFLNKNLNTYLTLNLRKKMK